VICERCGDGVLDSSEVCDDGNNASLDGCREDCRVIEQGYSCPPGGGVCTRCGNGVVDTANGEECDDGNTSSGDGCSSSCTSEGGPYHCSTPGALCDRCGNGVREASEACDNGGSCAGGANAGVPCTLDNQCGGGTRPCFSNGYTGAP
jgi:cysteine-rich repeat protein